MKLNKELLDKARGCDSCLEWHPHCHAECCKVFYLRDEGFDLSKKFFYVEKPFVPDIVWYWTLHGCRWSRGKLKVPTKYALLEGNIIAIYNRCEYLNEDNTCQGHPTTKPKACRELTLERLRTGQSRCTITKNCLFRYQLENDFYDRQNKEELDHGKTKD